MNAREGIPCECCEGVGLLERMGMDEDGIFVPTYEQCFLCFGTGTEPPLPEDEKARVE